MAAVLMLRYILVWIPDSSNEYEYLLGSFGINIMNHNEISHCVNTESVSTEVECYDCLIS